MDSMDIDSGPKSSGPPPKPRRSALAGSSCIATTALTELYDALSPFIVEQARIALGDLYEAYLPPPDADVSGLLRYIEKKWLSIFCDSPLESQRATIERLKETANEARRALNPLREDVSRRTVKDVQSVLLAIRKPGAAARVARLLDSPEHETNTVPTRTAAPDRAAGSERRSHGNSQHVPPSAPVQEDMRVPIALDGSNIAWRHGLSERFSMRGVAEALAYFTGRGHPCVVFLPEGRLREAPTEDIALPEGEREAFAALKALEGSSMLVLTPEKDYDDCYLTHFAREYQAVICSNDRFADQVYQAEAEGRQAATEWQRWIAACRLPFTFHGHAFVPNPSFNYARAASVARELAKPAVARPT